MARKGIPTCGYARNADVGQCIAGIPGTEVAMLLDIGERLALVKHILDMSRERKSQWDRLVSEFHMKYGVKPVCDLMKIGEQRCVTGGKLDMCRDLVRALHGNPEGGYANESNHVSSSSGHKSKKTTSGEQQKAKRQRQSNA